MYSAVMDERKRTYAADEESVGQLKRLRPEEILGTTGGEPNTVVTRILVNKSMFSKIIGKGGQSIANLRSTSGAHIKGTNLDEVQRLVVLSGVISHVIIAFDMILQLVCSGSAVNSVSSAEYMRHGMLSVETHNIVLLIEHGKVGRVVGQKGSTLQALKQKSGAVVRVEQVPVEYAGVSLRSVSLEGSIASIQRAHVAIQELFVDQLPVNKAGLGQQGVYEQRSQPQVSAYGNGSCFTSSAISVPARGGYPSFPVVYPMLPAQGFVASASATYGYNDSTGAMGQHTAGYNYNRQQQRMPATQRQRSYQQKESSTHLPVPSASSVGSQPDPSTERNRHSSTPAAESNSALALTNQQPLLALGDRQGWAAPLSASVLLNAGVPSSTVSQLVGLQTYLLRDFGLELALASVTEQAGRNGALEGGNSAELVIAQRNQASPFELCFAVPNSCVGGIIGRGGKLLRALQAEFGVRVYVMKEDYLGQRIVCLTYTGNVHSDSHVEAEETEKLQQDDANNIDSVKLQRDIEVELDFDQLRTGDREAGDTAAVTGDESRTRRSDDMTDGPPLKKRSTIEDRTEEEQVRADSVPEAPALSKVRGRSREDPTEGNSPLVGQGSAVKRNRRDDLQDEDELRETESATDAPINSILGTTTSTTKPSLSKKRETRDSADSLESNEHNQSNRKASKLARGDKDELLEAEGEGGSGSDEESTSPVEQQLTSDQQEGKDVSVARTALQRCKERIEAVMEDLLQRQQVRDISDQPL